MGGRGAQRDHASMGSMFQNQATNQRGAGGNSGFAQHSTQNFNSDYGRGATGNNRTFKTPDR